MNDVDNTLGTREDIFPARVKAIARAPQRADPARACQRLRLRHMGKVFRAVSAVRRNQAFTRWPYRNQRSEEQCRWASCQVKAVLEPVQLQAQGVMYADTQDAQRGVENAEDQRQPDRRAAARPRHQHPDPSDAPDDMNPGVPEVDPQDAADEVGRVGGQRWRNSEDQRAKPL